MALINGSSTENRTVDNAMHRFLFCLLELEFIFRHFIVYELFNLSLIVEYIVKCFVVFSHG